MWNYCTPHIIKKTWRISCSIGASIYCYLKCIGYDKLLKPWQSFWITLYIISYIEPGFRRYEVCMSEWVRHSTLADVTMNSGMWMTPQLVCSWCQWLRGFHCYDGAWFSNGIKTLFRASAALPPLPVGFLWLSLSLPSVTTRVSVVTRFPSCVRIFTMELRLWVTLHSLFLLLQCLRGFLGWIRAWILSVVRIRVWLGTKFWCLRLKVVFEWPQNARFNVCNRAWWFDRVDTCVNVVFIASTGRIVSCIQ